MLLRSLSWVLSEPDLRNDAKVAYAALLMNLHDVPTPEEHGLTESEIALAAGMSPHQARAAVATLRRFRLVERQWLALGQSRPVPVFRCLMHPEETRTGQEGA